MPTDIYPIGTDPTTRKRVEINSTSSNVVARASLPSAVAYTDQANGFTVSQTPSTAGGANLGSASIPWQFIYLGTAATNNVKLQAGTITGARVVTFPDANSNTVQPLGSATSHNWLQYIDANGVQTLARPGFTDLSGSIAVGQLPSTTVDATGISNVGYVPTITGLGTWSWQAQSGGGGGADSLGSYIVQTATHAPANAQVLASLSTGLLKVTTSTGVLSAATANTDYLPVASPAMTGTPTAPTATGGTNTTQIATTAFVQNAVSGLGGGGGGLTDGGTVTADPNPASVNHRYSLNASGGAFNFTLPNPSGNAAAVIHCYLANMGGNAVTFKIQTAGNFTSAGAVATITDSNTGNYYVFVCDGTGWVVQQMMVGVLGSGSTGATSNGGPLAYYAVTADPAPATYNAIYKYNSTGAGNTFTLPTAVGWAGAQIWLRLAYTTTTPVTINTTSGQTWNSAIAHASGGVSDGNPGNAYGWVSNGANWELISQTTGL